MFYPAISAILFYVFALAALLCAVGVVAFRNPVTSALSMALCFGFTAAIFFNLGADFLGIAQIIIYAGAILVLFLFIIMMLDVKKEEGAHSCWLCSLVGVVLAGVFAGMLANAALQLPGARAGRCPVHVLAESSCALCVGGEPAPAAEPRSAAYGGMLPELKRQDSDTKLLGENIFTHYNLTFVILSFALLAGAIGAVAVGRKLRKD